VADFLEFLRERVPGLWTPQEVFTPPPMPEPASTPIVPANYDIDLFHQRPVPKQYQPGHDRWSFWQEEMAKSEEALRQGDQFGQVQHSGGAAPGALGAALTAENEVVSQGTLGGYVYKVAKTKGTPLEGFVRGSGGMMDQVNPVSRALGISTEDIYNRADEIVAAYESAPYGKEQMAWDTFRRGMVPVQAGLAETLLLPVQLHWLWDTSKDWGWYIYAGRKGGGRVGHDEGDDQGSAAGSRSHRPRDSTCRAYQQVVPRSSTRHTARAGCRQAGRYRWSLRFLGNARGDGHGGWAGEAAT